MEDPSEYIDFMVNYKDWIAIRRLGIRSITKPEEIAFHLSGITSSIDSKIYGILGINTEILDKAANSLTEGKKRSYELLADSLKGLANPEIKRIAKSACANETSLKIAEIYLLNKVIKNLNFSASVTPELLAKLFPDAKLKLPGMLGRKKKGQSK